MLWLSIVIFVEGVPILRMNAFNKSAKHFHFSAFNKSVIIFGSTLSKLPFYMELKDKSVQDRTHHTFLNI